ncbi:hypothetical protein BANRA_02956 [Escherichia coli]|nr:hypothetical protein BANRA_02956 [Escherichia coli]
MRLASRFGYANQIRRDRPLTHEELMHYVPGIFGKITHVPKPELYVHPHHHRTGKPAAGRLSAILRLPDPCATRAAGDTQTHAASAAGRRDKRRTFPEIILLNSHDGSSSYQMLPGYFRAICTNGRSAVSLWEKCVFRTGKCGGQSH